MLQGEHREGASGGNINGRQQFLGAGHVFGVIGDDDGIGLGRHRNDLVGANQRLQNVHGIRGGFVLQRDGFGHQAHGLGRTGRIQGLRRFYRHVPDSGIAFVAQQNLVVVDRQSPAAQAGYLGQQAKGMRGPHGVVRGDGYVALNLGVNQNTFAQHHAVRPDHIRNGGVHEIEGNGSVAFDGGQPVGRTRARRHRGRRWWKKRRSGCTACRGIGEGRRRRTRVNGGRFFLGTQDILQRLRGA